MSPGDACSCINYNHMCLCMPPWKVPLTPIMHVYSADVLCMQGTIILSPLPLDEKKLCTHVWSKGAHKQKWQETPAERCSCKRICKRIFNYRGNGFSYWRQHKIIHFNWRVQFYCKARFISMLSFVQAQQNIHFNKLLYLWKTQGKSPCTYSKPQLKENHMVLLHNAVSFTRKHAMFPDVKGCN